MTREDSLEAKKKLIRVDLLMLQRMPARNIIRVGGAA